MPPTSLTRTQFDAFVRPLYRSLHSRCAARFGSENADDLVQDILYRTWTHIARFDVATGQRGFSRFLIPFTHAVCADYFRATHRLHETATSPDEVFRMVESCRVAEGDDEREWRVMREEMYRRLERVTLTGSQEMCLRLWLSGSSQTSIAEQIGVSQPTVAEHIAAAVMRLRAGDPPPEVALIRVYRAACRPAVYRKPTAVFDRSGTAEQIQRRRFAAAGLRRREPCMEQSRRAKPAEKA